MTDVGFYGELGFTDWLTGTLSTQYRVAVREAKLRATGRDSTLSASGLGDIWLGGRIRLLPVEDSTAATLMLGLKIPTGSRNQAIPLGTGVLDYEISAAAGRHFRLADMLSATAQLSAGFRLRNVANNEFVYMAQGGVNLARVLLLQLTFDGILSTGNYDPARDASIDAFIGDQSFFRWNMGLVYSTADNMELRVDYGRQVAGRNALAGHSIAFGIAWKK
jgi:hypothetical protein